MFLYFLLWEHSTLKKPIFPYKYDTKDDTKKRPGELNPRAYAKKGCKSMGVNPFGL